MKGSILWKFALTALALIWAVSSLVPLQEQDFATFVQRESSARTNEFSALVAEARAKVDAGEARSVLVGLRSIANERRIDLSEFFPHLRMDPSLRNVEKRNQMLLAELSRRSKPSLQLGLDIRGGVSFTLEVDERTSDANERGSAPSSERAQQLNKAIEIIGARINQLGVTEPIIRAVGENRIQVQLAGVNTRDDPEIINVLRKPARLDFRLVHPTLSPSGAPGEEAPLGYEILNLETEDETGRIVVVPYFVKRIPEMMGDSVASASVQLDPLGRFQVGIRFTSEGGRQFARLTEQHVGQLMAIVLDGRLYSAPRINEPIRGGSGQITGRFSQREAFELANVLNNPLDLPLRVAEMTEVGPTLAKDAIESGKRAVIIGTVLVSLFMVAAYLLKGGIIALITLSVNIVMVLGVLSSLGATLTLPGIAGIVLTMGMAVDANILIYERIREELRAGKGLKAALAAGYDRAFTTIIDANLTTLITSATMIALGNGPVKGFGITVTIGIFTTVFTSLVLCKGLLQWLINFDIIKRFEMTPVFQNTKIDFMRFARPAFVVSWAVILVGAAATVINWDKAKGIDFAGGDEVSFSFVERIPESAVRDFGVRSLGLSEVTPTYQSALGGGDERLVVQVPFESGMPFAEALIREFPKAGLAVTGSNFVGPAVGKEILWNAIFATLIGLVGILIYVAFRFEMGFGLGAVVSTLHDVLMVVGIYVLFGKQMNAPMVAAVLLIIGYSINDTIVVFDRIREELILNPTMKLREVINKALNATLSRTVLTTASTLAAAFSLYIFGSGVIQDLAFAFIIGILTGVGSTVFISAPIFHWYHKGQRAKLDQAILDDAPRYDWETGAKPAKG
jgi:SecD/SecF fusion protein